MAYEPIAGSFEFRDLAERLRRLEELLAVASGEPLESLVRAAHEGVPGASAVSITTLHNGRFMTEASSSQRALDADGLQYTLRSGPCVEAVLHDEIYNPRDLARDPRWPQFGPQVSAELGINSCLSYQLAPDLIIDATRSAKAQEVVRPPAGRSDGPPRPFTAGATLTGHRSSLNIYGDAAGAFGQEALATGLVFAAYAVSLITASVAQDIIHHLEQALINARQIGVAVGIVMNAQDLSQEDAFNVLRIASQNSNRKINDLAAELTRTGDLPVHALRDRTREG